MAVKRDLRLLQGETFSRVLRWEAPPIIYKSITAISQTAPVSITATAHGLPDGWRAAVVSVRGMTQLNAEDIPPRESDYRKVTVVDVNTVQINEVNAADFSPYVSGGYLQFNTPVNMAGYSARMSIKDKVGGTQLLRLDTTNGGINIDNTAKTITLTVSATDTAALTWTRGVYDLEMVSGTGVVTTLMSGTVSVTRETTTT